MFSLYCKMLYSSCESIQTAKVCFQSEIWNYFFFSPLVSVLAFWQQIWKDLKKLLPFRELSSFLKLTLHAKPRYGSCSQQNIIAPAGRSAATKTGLLTWGYFGNYLPLIYNWIWKTNSSVLLFHNLIFWLPFTYKCFSRLIWILKVKNRVPGGRIQDVVEKSYH